jgi:hypothetical protein
MAYTNTNISGEGSGCVMWFGDLNDIRKFDDDGQDLYIRMDASEFSKGKDEFFMIVVNIVVCFFLYI